MFQAVVDIMLVQLKLAVVCGLACQLRHLGGVYSKDLARSPRGDNSLEGVNEGKKAERVGRSQTPTRRYSLPHQVVIAFHSSRKLKSKHPQMCILPMPLFH